MRSYDVSNESLNFVAEGIQHKYKSTLVVFVSNKCLSICDHCFRKRIFEDNHLELDKIAKIEDVINYLNEHKEINSILLTGGDAFLSDVEYLNELLIKLNQIEHVLTIRLGTRALVQNSEIFYKFEKIFTSHKINKFLHIIYHILTPNEITEDLINFNKSNRHIFNFKSQTPLLNTINANSNILAELWEKLLIANIEPYYVFQCRPVKGNEKYCLPFRSGFDIFEKSKKNISGIGKTAKMIMSCDAGKLEFVCKYNGSSVILKFHQARKEEDLGTTFMAPNDAIWYSNGDFVYEK